MILMCIRCVSVRLTLIAGLEELWVLPRAQWVLRWPGQVVIAGSQTAWTAGVEAAIDDYRMDVYFEEMLRTVLAQPILNCHYLYYCKYFSNTIIGNSVRVEAFTVNTIFSNCYV